MTNPTETPTTQPPHVEAACRLAETISDLAAILDTFADQLAADPHLSVWALRRRLYVWALRRRLWSIPGVQLNGEEITINAAKMLHRGY